MRAMLRRLRIGERRWIPRNDERAAHTDVVLGRLPEFKDRDVVVDPTVEPPPGE